MDLSSTPGAQLITQISYNATQDIEYVGYAAPGSATNEKVWKIINITYNVNDNIESVIFAEGTRKFDKEWDNRADYTYS